MNTAAINIGEIFQSGKASYSATYDRLVQQCGVKPEQSAS